MKADAAATIPAGGREHPHAAAIDERSRSVQADGAAAAFAPAKPVRQRPAKARWALPLEAAAGFAVLASGFFLAIGSSPVVLAQALVEGAFTSSLAFSEMLVKAAPILLCALAAALPARVGLISVGGEGQLCAGAIAGTGFVLLAGDALGGATLPCMLLAAALGGAAYGGIAGWLRVWLHANETITTLLLNYLAPLAVSYLVYGPWKDPESLGWPATRAFPEAARLPTYFDTRVHFGLVLGILILLAAHFIATRTRTGLALDLLRLGPALAERAGVTFAPRVVLTLALGGACAGIAGIAEAAVIEGRLQDSIAAGAGYSGFLVAFLARGHLLAMLPLSLVVASLAAAGDNLQLSAGLPSAIVYVLQGLAFAAGLIAYGRQARAATTEVA